MLLFWILAIILLIIAYSFFAPSLLNRPPEDKPQRERLNLLIHKQRRRELEQEYPQPGESQEDYKNLTAELDKDLLNDLSNARKTGPRNPSQGRWLVIVALVLSPLIGFVVYAGLGRMDLLGRQQAASGQAADEAADMQASIQQLAKRLEANPADLQGWLLLGRSLEAIGQPDRAVTAYEFAQKLAPDELNIKAFYAQALAGANHDRLAGKPAEIIAGILATDPNHKTGLWLAGLAAAEQGKTAEAVAYWQRLKAQFAQDSEEARQLDAYIAQIQAGPPAAVTETQPPRAETPTSKRIHVTVSLAESLKRQASASDTVFIFARAAQGPPMPLAIARKQVSDLPVQVTLDDSMAMAPGMNLSSFDTIVIGARVSRTGSATPAPGDLQGLSQPTKTADQSEYRIQIDQVVQ